MGAEGYIVVAPITDGAHFLNGETPFPWFRVTEPVAVLPKQPDMLGGAPNFDFGSNPWTWLFTVCDQTQLVFIPKRDWPVLLLAVTSQDLVMAEYERAKRRRDGAWDEQLTIGAIPVPELKTSWDKITPGFWAVTSYRTSGLGDDGPRFHLHQHLHPSYGFGEQVAWEIWT